MRPASGSGRNPASRVPTARAAAARASPIRRAARLTAVCLTATCVLAACSGSGAQHGAQRGGQHKLSPFRRFGGFRLLPRPIIVFGGDAAGGGAVAFLGGGFSSGGGAGSRPKISVPPIPPANSSLPIAMPLDSYQAISTQQQEALAQASSILTQRCMAARGFEDSTSAAGPFTGVTNLLQIESSGAGLTSLAQAKTFGFAQPKGAGSQGSGGPQIIGIVGQSDFGASLKIGKAYTEALYGFSPGGGAAPAGHVSCAQQASQQVYGPLNGTPAPDPVPQIAQQAVSFTQTDPRIRAVDRAWSRCMARRFYRYSSPSQVEGRHWPSPPDKAEIRTAVADVACKTQTNLLNTWLTVEGAYQQALIGRNLATLSQLQANFAPLLRRAEAALAAPPGLGTPGQGAPASQQ